MNLRLLLLTALAAAMTLACTAPAAQSYEFGTQMTPYEADMSKVSRLYSMMPQLGNRWVRIDAEWSYVQGAGPTSWNFARVDAHVDLALWNNVKPMVVLTYTPEWARPSGYKSEEHAAPQGTMIAKYGEYCRRTAERYNDPAKYPDPKRRVLAYEIWNEANHQQFFRPYPNVVQYTQMLKVCSLQIRSVQPNAIIVTSGTSPTGTVPISGLEAYCAPSAPVVCNEISPVDFVKGIYRQGARGSFNAVGAHPYTWGSGTPSTSSEKWWNAWSQMGKEGFVNQTMRTIMVANGDADKKIWATEWGASENSIQDDGSILTQNEQAEIYADGMRLWKSYSWSGVLFAFALQDFNSGIEREADFGMVRRDFSIKASYLIYIANNGGQTPVEAAPSVFMASPTASQIVKGTSAALIAGGSNIARVRFVEGGTVLGTSGPCTFFGCILTFDSTRWLEGKHSVVPIGLNASGTPVALAPALTFRVKNTVPATYSGRVRPCGSPYMVIPVYTDLAATRFVKYVFEASTHNVTGITGSANNRINIGGVLYYAPRKFQCAT